MSEPGWVEKIRRANHVHAENARRRREITPVCPRCGHVGINPHMHCPSCSYDVFGATCVAIRWDGLRCQSVTLASKSARRCFRHIHSPTKTPGEWLNTAYPGLIVATEEELFAAQPTPGAEGER